MPCRFGLLELALKFLGQIGGKGLAFGIGGLEGKRAGLVLLEASLDVVLHGVKRLHGLRLGFVYLGDDIAGLGHERRVQHGAACETLVYDG